MDGKGAAEAPEDAGRLEAGTPPVAALTVGTGLPAINI